MSLGDWLRETRNRFASKPAAVAIRESIEELYFGVLRRLDVAWNLAPTVYDREWDLLIVLDACRVDLIRSVAAEYPFVRDVDRIASPASQSRKWLQSTFADEHADAVARTAYVTGNPYSEEVLDPRDLALLDEVWRYAWDEERATIPPRPVTDRAITAARERNPDRLVVHYMQPHLPSLTHDDIEARIRRDDTGWVPGHAWDQLEAGDLSEARLWDAYRDNLRVVLDDVAVLLDNVDANRVVITADHGNAFGEWGVYGHPPDMPLPSLHLVPWVETTATDRGSHEPATYDREDDDAREERLRDLGYL